MIVLSCIIAWYLTGLLLAYLTLTAIDPVVSRADLLAMFFAGFIGPIGILHYITYADSDWWRKPVHTARRGHSATEKP